jgi:hypothetical protein
MSIDAFTGRNPSYCFVDMYTESDASLALQTMQGQLVRWRPVKLNRNTQRQRPKPQSATEKRLNTFRYRDDVSSHWTAPAMENRRLYVGGLPQIAGQRTLNAEMAALFHGYDIEAVSKLIWPHSSRQDDPGSHFYAFVDLATAGAAASAAHVLNGRPTPHGGTYIVSRSQRTKGSAKVYREQLSGSARMFEGRVFVGGLPALEDVEAELRAIFAGHRVRSVGDLITAVTSKQIEERRFYCFVDFDSATEAQAVVAAFAGNELGLIVDLARAPGRGDGTSQEVSSPEVVLRDFSKSWRRQDVSAVA